MYKTFAIESEFRLKNGHILPELTVAYETWGNLNSEKTNAIIVLGGLTANSHAKSNENQAKGWWEDFIGEGLFIDTKNYFVICYAFLGSSYGTTGPSSINPKTGKSYGMDFPVITIDDILNSQIALMDHLGIQKLYAAVGSSLGALITLLMGIKHSSRVEKVISFSGGAQTDPMSLAIMSFQRKVIMLDPNWHNGDYYEKSVGPNVGLSLSRSIAMTTYRTREEWETRFKRDKLTDKVTIFDSTYQVESYLNYQGEKFVKRFDANSLLYILKSIEIYDVSEDYESLRDALSNIKCQILIGGSPNDNCFPFYLQKKLARQIYESGNKDTYFIEIESLYGHDAFLLSPEYGATVQRFLENKMQNYRVKD